MERALNGVEVPVYSYGKLVGTRRVHNDRLLMFLLRTRAKKRFGEDGRMNLADRSALDNLKRQWRKQWDREQYELSLERSREAQAGINEKLTSWEKQRTIEIARAMRAEWLRLGGPPSIPGDEDLDEMEDVEFEETEAEFEDASAAEPAPTEPNTEPAAPADHATTDAYRTVSLKHGWPDDGRATPFYGRY